MTHTAPARFTLAVALVCALGNHLFSQNVGAYGMATKPPPPTPETFKKLEIQESEQQKIVFGIKTETFGTAFGGLGVACMWEQKNELATVLGTTPPLDGTWYDHNANSVSLREVIGGKTTILVPIYIRCPRLCGETIENLMTCLRLMRAKDREMTPGKAFNLIFISIDDHEHPRVAAPRRELFLNDLDGRGVNEPGVWFLCANRGQFSDPAIADRTIHEVTNSIGYHFVKADKKGREIQHPTAVLVLTPTGRVSSYNTAIAYDATELIEQIRTASDGQAGSTSSLSSLSCFLGSDPTGMYRTAMRILGWTSVPVLCVVCGVVIVSWRRAKRDIKITYQSDAK
jgi:protein SCO1